ncbi:carbohydrate binding family 9 domain-containing protein, partial [Ignavibacterium sp.]|uniref:carbohydrate binding family 9 domain-containing protein n=1 Tax=Ignavibacterium sp. TaxID=2651167 RepID=UPI0025B9110D
MKKLLMLIAVLTLFAVASPNKNANKILHLKKINSELKIDGIIDNQWSIADSAYNFFQLDPFYGQKPSVETVAKVLADDEAIYCLIICFDEPDKLQTNAGMHDGFTGDIVSIILDTFNDKQTAYKFAVNASGVLADSRLLDDNRNRDYSWDGIWFAASKIYEWGYVVEMKIPFKSIKYDKSLTEWGIDFDRWRSFSREDLYWC